MNIFNGKNLSMSSDTNLQIINCRKRVWIFYYYVKQFTYPENEN